MFILIFNILSLKQEYGPCWVYMESNEVKVLRNVAFTRVQNRHKKHFIPIIPLTYYSREPIETGKRGRNKGQKCGKILKMSSYTEQIAQFIPLYSKRNLTNNIFTRLWAIAPRVHSFGCLIFYGEEMRWHTGESQWAFIQSRIRNVHCPLLQ